MITIKKIIIINNGYQYLKLNRNEFKIFRGIKAKSIWLSILFAGERIPGEKECVFTGTTYNYCCKVECETNF